MVSENNKVAVVTLGCARNEVDSEEMAGRLAANGWELVDDPENADAVLVNTCGFVEVAKKDSIDAILAVSDLKDGSRGPRAVVAVGCLAERYGRELADSLPEADAVLGFDDYPDIGETLRRIVAGEPHVPHTPTDRRQLLPISPVDRPAAAGAIPGHGSAPSGDEDDVPGWQPPTLRRRLDGSPVAPVKLASGCDRRCTFCAIPSFRGSFVSRPPADVVAAADRLWAFCAKTWPGARLVREWPVVGGVGLQRVQGRLDLLIETATGLVIVDHKTYPGRPETWDERVAGYAPQLDLYARLCVAATGRPVEGLYVHLPVTGSMLAVTTSAAI